jgi:ankyrin repeat protein
MRILTRSPELPDSAMPPPDQRTTTQANAKSPSHDAAERGDLENVRTLLQADPGLVSSKDEYGGTPLHWAAQMGQKAMAELRLSNSADANAKDNDARTPLHWAAETGQKDIIQLLLANKAEINAKANNGMTALHLAEQNGHKDVAELMRQHGGHE